MRSIRWQWCREFITGNSIRSKLVLWICLIYVFLSVLFGSLYYCYVEDEIEQYIALSSNRALSAVAAIVNTSVNTAVTNYLRDVVGENVNFISKKRADGMALEEISGSFALRRYYGDVQSYLVDTSGTLLTPYSQYRTGDSLWNALDANGAFYFQEMASLSASLLPEHSGVIFHLEGGEQYVSVFSYYREFDWIIVSSVSRRALLSLVDTNIFREEIVSQKVGHNGSVEIFNDLGFQLVHSAMQFERNIRSTDTHQQIRTLKQGTVTVKERFSEVNSFEYVTTSSEFNNRLINKYYRFTYLPDVSWYLVIGVDLDEMYQPLDQMIIASVALIMLFMLLIIYISIKVSERLLLLDIARLDDAIALFGQQNFATRIAVNRDDELGRLGSGFNEMAQTIEDYALKMQQQVSNQSVQLREAEKNAALGTFVAGFSHEINTPIGICVTAASHLSDQMKMIKKQIESGKIKKSELVQFLNDGIDSTQILDTSLEGAARLVSSFKVMAVDQSRHEIRRIGLKEYIENIFYSLKHEHKRYLLTFVVNCPADLFLTCDPSHFYQIFNNLIINSLRHGLTPKIPSTIQIDISVDEYYLNIQYRDNGKGIADDILANIFKAFVTSKRDKGGSGIGMHIIEQLVTKEFNGVISCKNDNGAVFVIRLPIENFVVSKDD